MIKTEMFEKARRYGLLAAIGSTALLLFLKVLEGWGAFTTSEPYDYYSDYYGGQNSWGKLESTLGYIIGFSAGIVILVLFVVPRKKSDKG